ncbi:MAG: TrkA C-terminal domain-containing protein [Owenweeksia sp.]|nr:TrkA C-terminal domain-containing protein [Owenweeksia sp.]
MAEIASRYKDRKYVAVAIKRGDETIIPKGNTIVEPGDHLFVITHTEGLEEVLEVTGKRKIEVSNIIIMGGSRTGRHLVRKLSKDYHVKLIEQECR